MSQEEICAWCGHVDDKFDHVPCREGLEAEARGELVPFVLSMLSPYEIPENLRKPKGPTVT